MSLRPKQYCVFLRKTFLKVRNSTWTKSMPDRQASNEETLNRTINHLQNQTQLRILLKSFEFLSTWTWKTLLGLPQKWRELVACFILLLFRFFFSFLFSLPFVFTTFYSKSSQSLFGEGLTEDTSQIVLTFCFFMVPSKTKPDTSSLLT